MLSDSNGYGVQGGLMYSFPCKCVNGDWSVVEGLPINPFSQQKMKVTEQELAEERDLAFSLLR